MTTVKKKTATAVNKTKSKKYQSLSAIGLDCLNCTLPTHVCCGVPRQCRAKYEKYLAKKAEEERKRKVPRTRRGRNVPNESI